MASSVASSVASSLRQPARLDIIIIAETSVTLSIFAFIMSTPHANNYLIGPNN